MDDPHRDAMASAAERVLREWFESRKPWKLMSEALERAMQHFLEQNREQIIEAIARSAAPPSDVRPQPTEQQPRRFNERHDEDDEWDGPIDANGLPPFPDELDF